MRGYFSVTLLFSTRVLYRNSTSCPWKSTNLPSISEDIYLISTTVTASTWAALAVTAACLAIPGLNAVYAKCVALISTGVKSVPMVLTSILKLMPKFTAALI